LQRVSDDLAELRRDPPPGHLWFLYYLVLFAALAALFRVAAGRVRLEALERRVDRLFGSLVRSPLLPFVMALPTAATLLFVRGLESETPLTYVPQLHILAYYAVFFGFGWMLHRQSALVDDLRRHAWCGLLAIALLPLLLACVAELGRTGTLPPGKRLAALYGVALFTWLAGMSILAVAVRVLDRPRAWVRWLADSSYWCYLVHLPVVFFLHIVVSGLAWPGAVKYTLVMAGTLSACLAGYRAFVRYTFLGTWLNGRRERPVRV
jgi:peptidoglycan/LPS O-acetylase OafA/YrhL